MEFTRNEPVKNGEFELALRFQRERPHWPPIALVKIVKGAPEDFPWHRLGEEVLCHLATSVVEWDPESPQFVQNVLFVSQRAIQEFHRLQKGEALTEADFEFATHWQGLVQYLDIPKATWPPVKGARLERLEFTCEETGSHHDVVRIAGAPRERYQAFFQQSTVQLVPAVYIDLVKHPGPLRQHWPPVNLSDLNTFLHQHQPRDGKRFWRDLADALDQEGAHMAKAFVVMDTRAGRYGALLQGGKGELPGFRRQSLPELLRQHNQLTRLISVTRVQFLALDEEFVLTRNQPGATVPLAGKSIHLIGLGAIGSILADRLAQAGAGSKGGALHLFDYDVLRPENIGRHLLGVPYLGMNKADGVALHLRRNRLNPGVVVHPEIWLDPTVHRGADLVIDATAVPLIGAALCNEARAHRDYAVASVFVEGEGWVAGVFLYRGVAGEACRSCLEPWPGGEGANVQMAHAPPARDNGCGATYMAFRAPAADIAASLASELICEWADGKPGKTYRTFRLPSAPSHVHASRNETPVSKAGCQCSLGHPTAR